MQRWHLTTGLGLAALTAAAIAPTLRAQRDTPVVAVDPPATVIPAVVVEQPFEAPGHVRVTARLDRSALIAHHAEERYLAIEVVGLASDVDQPRVPVDIVALIDTSGSMRARHKIDDAIEATRVLSASLNNDDRLSIITFDNNATTLLPLTSVRTSSVASAALGAIHASGSTNVYGGLAAAGEQLRTNHDTTRARRVLLLSDGEPTVGITDPKAIADLGSTLAREGITVSAMGLGLEFNEDLLAQLADAGGGTYAWIDAPSDVPRRFNDELHRASSLVARDTVIDIVLPPEVEGLDLFGWEAERTASGWRVHLGDISAGDHRSILASVRVSSGAPKPSTGIATVNARYQDLAEQRGATSRAIAMASVTDDSNVASASLDADAAAAGFVAQAASIQQKTASLYGRGKRAEALAVLSEGSAFLAKPPPTPMAAPAARAIAARQAQLEDLTAAALPADEERALLKDVKTTTREGTRQAFDAGVR